MKNLISVIILSYKNIDGIYETLDSILKQTYKKIEIIISDDGTSGFDREKNRILTYINKHSKDNICNVVINAIKENVGTVKNINSAIKLAKGEYIKILSAEDCLIGEDALQKYYEFLSKSNYLICFAKMRGVFPDGTYKYELIACESNYNLLKGYSVKQLENRLYARNFLPAPAWFARRKLFEKYGSFPEDTRLIEDYPYWCFLAQKGVLFGYLDEILIDYKLSGVSSAGSYSEMFMKDMLIIYEKYIFPFDKRFGKLQGIYNKLKSGGLNYYMVKARWNKLTKMQKVSAYFKYGIYFVYTGLIEIKNNYKNKKIRFKFNKTY